MAHAPRKVRPEGFGDTGETWSDTFSIIQKVTGSAQKLPTVMVIGISFGKFLTYAL